MTAEDYLWRRTKLGLRVDKEGVERIEAHIESARTRASGGDRGTQPRSAS